MATSEALGFNMFSQMMQTMLNGVYNASSEQTNAGSNQLVTEENSPFTQLFNSSGNTTAGQQDFNTPPAMQFMSLMSQMMMAMMMFNPMGFLQMMMGMMKNQNQNQFAAARNDFSSSSAGGYQNVSYTPNASGVPGNNTFNRVNSGQQNQNNFQSPAGNSAFDAKKLAPLQASARTQMQRYFTGKDSHGNVTFQQGNGMCAKYWGTDVFDPGHKNMPNSDFKASHLAGNFGSASSPNASTAIQALKSDGRFVTQNMSTKDLAKMPSGTTIYTDSPHHGDGDIGTLMRVGDFDPTAKNKNQLVIVSDGVYVISDEDGSNISDVYGQKGTVTIANLKSTLVNSYATVTA